MGKSSSEERFFPVVTGADFRSACPYRKSTIGVQPFSFPGALPFVRTNHQEGFCVGGRRAAWRASSFAANSESFPETSRRKVAVRRSVSGATSSSTYLRSRAILVVDAPADFFEFVHDLPVRRLPEAILYYRNAQRVPQGGLLALPYQWQWRIDKWKNAIRGLFGGGNQQPRPRSVQLADRWSASARRNATNAAPA